jgi:hypothetical protein
MRGRDAYARVRGFDPSELFHIVLTEAARDDAALAG